MQIITVRFFADDDRHVDVPVYVTDDFDDFLNRLALFDRSPRQAIMVSSDVVWPLYLKSPETYPLWNLWPLLSQNLGNDADTVRMWTLYNTMISSKISLDPLEFIRLWIWKTLSQYVDDDTKWKNAVQALESTIPFLWASSISVLSASDRRTCQRWWDDVSSWPQKANEWKDAFHSEHQDLTQQNEKKVLQGEEYDHQPLIPLIEKQDFGWIEDVVVDTPECTGSIFNHLVVSEEFPIAHYKSFFKIHTSMSLSDDILQGIRHHETQKDDQSHYHDIAIYNRQGVVIVYIQNAHNHETASPTLRIQSLVLRTLSSSPSSTFIPEDTMTEDRLFAMLRLPSDVAIHARHRYGVRSICRFSPIAIDTSIFADMIMNYPTFHHFLTIHDSEKISRQNKSLFIYFNDPQVMATSTDRPVYVGVGYSQYTTSRYGQLTAVVSCDAVQDHHEVVIRITRSSDVMIVHSFQDKMQRLLSLYQTVYEQQYKTLYENLIAHFAPYFPPCQQVSPEDKTDVPKDPLTKLIQAEPTIFPRNIYGRHCQKIKPVIISDDEAKTIPKGYVVRFPPEPMKGFQPRNYTCPKEEWKGDTYPYVGLKKVAQSTHPFGYFPCCYKEKGWIVRNQKILDQLRSQYGTTGVTPSEIPSLGNGDTMPIPKPIDHIIRTHKLIDNMGQLGVLPAVMETFFFGIDPQQEYFRVGMPFQDSFLYALEYQHANRFQTLIRSPDTIRKEWARNISLLSLGLQEQSQAPSIEFLQSLLGDRDVTIDADHFYAIAEAFYDIRLICLYRSQEGMITLRQPFHNRSWYRTMTTIATNRPVIFIYEHWGGSMDDLVKIRHTHCELIIARQFNNQRVYAFSEMKFAVRSLLEFGYRYADGDQLINTASLTKPSVVLDNHITAQYIDQVGKVRILYLTSSQYACFCHQPLAPLAKPLSTRSKVLTYEILKTDPIVTSLVPLSSSEWRRLDMTTVHLATHPIRYGTDRLDLIMVCESLESQTWWSQLRLQPWTPYWRSIVAYIRPDITRTDTVFPDIQRRIRLASILQEYSIHLLAKFYLHHKDDSTLTESTIHDWMPVAVDHITMIVPDSHQYPRLTSETIPLTFQSNVPDLIHDNRLLVASPVQAKLVFFLEWFVIRRGMDSLTKAATWYEIPSYFQYTTDFHRQQNCVITNDIVAFPSVTGYSYLAEPLNRLDHPLRQPFYYYNVLQTGTLPMIGVCVADRDEAIRTMYYWSTKGMVKCPPPPLPGSISTDSIQVNVPTTTSSETSIEWTTISHAVGRLFQQKDTFWIALMDLDRL